MTEDQWLACTDPQAMLMYLLGREEVSERKLRLFTVACCKRIRHLIVETPCRIAIETTERIADGLAARSELEAANDAVRGVDTDHQVGPVSAYAVYVADWTSSPDWVAEPQAAALAAFHAVLAVAVNSFSLIRRTEEELAQSTLLRDIFGPLPFRPVPIKFVWLTWNDSTIKRLAEAIYNERSLSDGHLDNTRMAVLADALEDAGCRNADILNHCRRAGVHVRGCYVIDLLLGKE